MLKNLIKLGLIFFSSVCVSEVNQQTDGNNSPIFRNIDGNITINPNTRNTNKSIDIEYARFFGVQSLDLLSSNGNEPGVEYLDDSDTLNRQAWRRTWKYSNASLLGSQPWKEINTMDDYDLIYHTCTDPGIRWMMEKKKNKTFWCTDEMQELIRTSPSPSPSPRRNPMSAEIRRALLAYQKPDNLTIEEYENQIRLEEEENERNSVCTFKPTSSSLNFYEQLVFLKKKGIVKTQNPIKYLSKCQKNIGFLILYFKNTTNYKMSDIHITYKDISINLDNRPINKDIIHAKKIISPQIHKTIPYIDKGESILWLLFAYMKDSEGFPKSYMSSVVEPIKIQYTIQETGEVITKKIRKPLKNNAIRKYIPYGWYGQ